jgi:hypothetical protein
VRFSAGDLFKINRPVDFELACIFVGGAMYSIPKYPQIVSLIPESTPQLLDFVFNMDAVAKDVRYFQEKPGTGGQAGKQVLRCLVENEDGAMLDEMTLEPVRRGIFEIYAKRCLEPWLGQWLPVPFLRVRDQKWEDGGRRFECGPSDWARVRIVRHSESREDIRIVLAFDMSVEEPPSDMDAYFAVSPGDVDAHADYALAVKVRDNAWFLNQAWVDDWLRNAWTAFRSQRKNCNDDAPELEYLAGYLTMLDVLNKALGNTAVQVVKPAETPIDVDLVLDIGNSRTTGILVETRAQRSTDLNDSYLLQLRDMDRPEHVYMEPFETRLEFSEAGFGDDSLSRQSGRRTPAFVWPSPVRIGPEAARLSTQALCAEGITGMSSPKRYLWDERDWTTGWRYNMRGEQEPRVTRGPLPRVLNQSGTPLCCMDDRLFRNHPILRRQDTDIAFDSKFTRSSLMMFLLVEVLQQALVTINSPGQRVRRELPNVPRRLRQVILTVPAGMPVAEQRIYRRWADWAVRALWEVLGWRDYYIADHGKRSFGNDYRLSPRVRCNWDEATCTQLVFVYNEIAKKYQGDAHMFCNVAGAARRRYSGKPCIRVAAIDIGGGTTDLSITTFELASDAGSSSRMRPHIEMRDGFNIAGDDIVREIIRSVILPAVGAAAAQAGASHGEKALAALFGRDVIDNSQENRNRRAQCVRQFLTPAALCILKAYESMDSAPEDAGLGFTARDFFDACPAAENAPERPFSLCRAPSAAALEYIDAAVRRAGGDASFTVMDTPVRIVPKNIDAIIREVMGGVLANLCEVVRLYDCDMLLLTGRPSRWRGILSTVFAKLPLPPARILPMSSYRVGTWYPFADVSGTITDPKTTVVVGGILCSLAEGHLEGFSFDPSGIVPRSTARFIGEMDFNGQIKKPKVWFEVDVAAKEERTYTGTISFSNTITVGFRLLDVERWTTTRFYVLDFASEDARRASSGKTPYTVGLSLTLKEVEEDEPGVAAEGNERDEGEFRIEEITDRHGVPVRGKDIRMRLQTLPLDEGVWLDTGVVV